VKYWPSGHLKRYGDTLSGRGANNQHSSRDADTQPLSYHRPSEMFFASA